MSKSIRLSEKHGVNPTLLICPVCGEENVGIALLGKLKGDVEAPRQMADAEPCEVCKKAMEQGIMLIEVKDGEEGKENPYRTGYIPVITEEAANRLFDNIDFTKHRMLYVEKHILEILLDDQYKLKVVNKNITG